MQRSFFYTYCLWACLLVSGSVLSAQDLLSVSGTVTDEEGPLIGATVAVKGTGQGTVTGVDGGFTLNEVAPDDSLQVTYVGYASQTIAVGGQTTFTINLSENISNLGEVVVIGYQEVKRSDLTGATAVVPSEQINKTVTNSLAESLQGLASGVTVRSGGAPGAGATIEIRGAASFVNTNPLYVIDGMIADANVTFNNNDIESVQILKDASAAAIYGSRAANGVIIITTKSGRKGPIRPSLSVTTGIQQIPNRWDVMDAAGYAELQRTSYRNSGLEVPASVGDDFDPTIDTDWQDEVIQTGSTLDANLSASGGSDNLKYFVSGSHFRNDGVIIGRSFNRTAFRVNSTLNLGRITVGENLVLTNNNIRQPLGGFDTGNPFFDMVTMLPVIPVQADEYISDTNPGGWGIGTVDAVSYAKNQVGVTDLLREKINFLKLIGNAYVQVELVKGLRYKFNVGLENSDDFSKGLRRFGVTQFNAAVRPSSIQDNRSRFSSLLMEHTLNFERAFGSHTLNGVVGISDQQTQRNYTFASRSDLVESGGDPFEQINSATGESLAEGGVTSDYRTIGFLGRLNYNYAQKYYLTLTGRVDQDSRFSADNRTGIFPSVAGSWRISKEDFFQVPWIDDLKFNASYGTLGIVTLGSWDWRGTINNNPRAILGTIQVGATQAGLVNPDLRWENRKSQNYGIEAAVLDYRLTLSANYYRILSEDALVTNLPVATYLGNLGGSPPVNAGSIQNTGFEFEANYRQQMDRVELNVGFNLTTINNTVQAVGNRGEGIDYIQTGLTRSRVGEPLGEWYLLQTDGIFQSQAEVNAHAVEGTLIQPFAQPGDIRYVDVDGDGQITDQDRSFTGKSPWPNLQLGSQLGLSYANFDVSAQIIGVFGNTLYNSVRSQLDSYQNTNFRSDVSPWTPDNTNTDDPRIGVATNDQGLVDNARGNTDRWLEDGSYLRLRNLQIGYTIPQAALDRLSISDLRVYVTGQNLLTFTKYTGLDPDVQGNGILERGVDNGNWPSSRIVSLGLNLNF
ncbi:TonB-linked SusC/RagA family outer membrane protein [Neolewinella xylanilytica]|uniref:TonB-linked SusC/RagA family outer membrane protein n=1 Tax=Neolewinella xylanilytica TaxID=1514080 RepID=A0A2S6IAY4_9BACT|nr:TonB-dependent receptor [Neolewinella xylanilytica]PPK88636.1 TonB-linked SusC/RagA family outer membrane protein [Neolewinella xylanilytica]